MKIHMHSKPYFRKILMITCGVVLSLCLILSVILYYKTESATTDSILQSESERTESLLEQIDIFLNQFVRKNTVFSGLYIPYEEIDVTSNYWASTIFRRMLVSHTNSDNFTENVDISIGRYPVFPTPISHDRVIGEFSVFTIYAENITDWPYYFDLESINPRKQNRVTITVNGYHLSKSVFSYKDKDHLDYLLLPDGTILLTNNKAAFMMNIEDIHPALLSSIQDSQNDICKYENYFCFISEPDKYGFSVLSLADESLFVQQRKADITNVLIITAILSCLAIVVSSILSIVFYKPIKNTVNLVKTYIPEDILDYENEISFITQSLSRYLDNGSKMELAIPEMVRKTQEAQSAVLQHQINSHFLFNTLENIKAISVEELGVKNEIEEGIILLNCIIRESILHKNVLVSLEHELSLAKNYLALMKMRFTNVNIKWNVDFSLLNCIVFKFSLQPILENCFIHAFKETAKPNNEISIDIFPVSKDEFVISVTDNGSQLDDGDLIRINQLLNLDNENEYDTKHVGLQNVQKRIRTVFGPNYGITLSRINGNTLAQIHYPITKQ